LTETLIGLLVSAAAEWVDDPAVEDGESIISYSQLADRAGRLASELVAHGVKAGDRVGVLLPKSIDAVCSQYGVMWAGAAYVPLDAGAPAERHGFVMENCGIQVLITNVRVFSSLVQVSDTPLTHVIFVDDAPLKNELNRVSVSRLHDVWVRPALEPPISVGGDDLALILHTSGSTGTPKGVMISHANALAFVKWAEKTIGVLPTDRISSHAAFHFDLSVFDLYVASSSGATVVLVPAVISLFPAHLAKWIEDKHITIWYSVPSALVQMADSGELERFEFTRLRRVLFAGEVFMAKYLRKWMQKLSHADWYNLYGPTETNVCTYFQVREIPDCETPVPIGRAASGDTIFLRDDFGNRVSGLGQEGEIWVCGPTVAMGYWGDEEKTGERFIEEPDDAGGCRRLYRTGDFACWDENGNLIFKGRRDHMVKSRGYRIELGEIEAVASGHPAVMEVCVVAVPDPQIGNRILANVVRDPASDLDRKGLEHHLSQKLPRYMLPQEVNFLDSLPKTATGKIDRRAIAGALQ
jgi:amino acid adenylation domain-containing protein